jgi:hypothetical protein
MVDCVYRSTRGTCTSFQEVILLQESHLSWPAFWAGLPCPPSLGQYPIFRQVGAAWHNDHNDFILPSSGPGPITWDPAHPYFGNSDGPRPTARFADLTNPTLMPWVKEELREFNQGALAGKVQYTPTARCRPAGVSGRYPLAPQSDVHCAVG